MQKTICTFGLILIMVAPGFSALLTDDLEVITPIGLPLMHDCFELAYQMNRSNSVITLRLIETSNGFLLIREYSRSGVVQYSQPVLDAKINTCIIRCNASSGHAHEGELMKVNVVLE